MKSPRYAELVSKYVADARLSEGPPPSAPARAAAIGALEGALRAKKQRMQRRRTIIAVAAAAAFVALGAGGARFVLRSEAPVARGSVAPNVEAPAASPAAPSPAALTMVGHPTGAGATLENNSTGDAPLVEGTLLRKGSKIVARAEGGVRVALSTGTQLSLNADARLTVDGDGLDQFFSLQAGEVEAKVAKLTPDQRFVIRTTDAEVEVRGTKFQVSYAAPSANCGGGTPTRVAVSEGLVIVRHHGTENRVAAGESWPNCTAERRLEHRVAPKESAERLTAAASRLAEQNELYARAIAYRREGSPTEAVATFDTLLRKFPSGPLAENATVDRMRALRGVDHGAAQTAARDYLKRYPAGFATAEARAVADGAP